MALSVDGIAQRIHDAPKQRIADRNAHHDAQPVHPAQALDVLIAAKDNAADAIRLDVEHHAVLAAFKSDHLAKHDVGHAVEPADAVGNAENAADLILIGLLWRMTNGVCHAGEHLRGIAALDLPLVQQRAQARNAVDDRAVIHRIADAKLETADQRGVDLDPERGLAVHFGEQLLHLAADALDERLRHRVGGGQRDVQNVMLCQIHPVARRDADVGQNTVHHLRFVVPECCPERLLCHPLGSQLLRPLDHLIADIEQHCAAHILASLPKLRFQTVFLFLRLVLDRLDRFGRARPLFFNRQRRLFRRNLRLRERALRLIERGIDPLAAGTENSDDLLSSENPYDPRQKQDIDQRIQ